MWNMLKMIFAKRADPYAGGDIELTHRLGAWFWIVNSVLAVALWPLSPLDRQVGDVGWLIGDALVILSVGFALALRSPRIQIGFVGVLISCYVGALGIATMQWLAGGETAPYDGLLLTMLQLVAATNPPRRLLFFVGYMAALLWAPLVYGGWESATAAKVMAEFVIWTPLGFLVMLTMSAVRADRLRMRDEEEQAREEARLDELTGICNRRAFEERIHDEISRANRMETPLSMAMGDIEHFKAINDNFGHLAGDEALRCVARVIDGELRTPDRAFRWGGDEFALLLPGTGRDDAEVLIRRVQAAVGESCHRPDGDPVWIHFAAAEHERGMSPSDLSEAADLALMQERASSHRARA